MADSTDHRTSPTLLGRLRHSPTDQAAWTEFVDRYGPIVYSWCRRWGLQTADAEDVTQNVLLDLGRQMRNFDYRPTGKFRAWLRTVSHRAWCDFLESRKRRPAGAGDPAALIALHSAPAGEDFVQRLDAECERELVDVAMTEIRGRVEDRTWEAFRLTALDGLSAAETAAKVGLSVASVFQAKSRIQKMLQVEVKRLDLMEAG